MDEGLPLMGGKKDGGGQSAAPSRLEAAAYQSFDNMGMTLADEETDLTEKTPPQEKTSTRKPRRQNSKKPEPEADTATIRTLASEAGSTVTTTAECDFDASSIVSTEPSETALSGEDLVFRLRLAHIYGDLDWAGQLRQLKDRSRDEVHVQILDNLRNYPINIHDKISLSRYLRNRLDTASVLSLSQKQARRRQERRHTSFGLGLGVWNGNISKISAYFGSHVASYFVFLRFLVFLDLLVAVLMLALVTLPQIVAGDDAPDGLGGDFGVVSTSVMFFGAYADSKWGVYDRPMAFFLTWASVNILCFLVIVTRMYIRFRESKRSDAGEEDFPFCARVFSSWDHTLSKPEGVDLRTQAIVTNTKEMVREERSQERATCCQSLSLYTIRLLVNVLVLGVLAGSGFIIYLVADSLGTSIDFLPQWLDDLLANYRLPLVVAALKMCVPPLLDRVILLEKWPPRTELKLTIARTALFYLASIVVFLLSMYDVTTECIRDSNSTQCAPVVNVTGADSGFCCWENEVGEEVFKVVLIDLGQILLTTVLFDHLRALVIRCGACSKLGFREFAVASEVLDVIYGQSLIWLGLFFSPLLAAVGFLKLIVVFYFRYVTARMCNVPPRTVFRASRSGNFFMFILLINFFVCLVTMIYAIIQLEPSICCGPFKAEDKVYQILTSRVGDLPTWLNDAIVYVSTPGIVVPLILFLLLAVLYFKAKSTSYVKVIDKLRDQLKFERRVEKREVFARARIVQGGRQISKTGSMPRKRRASKTSLASEVSSATTTTTTLP